MLRVLTVAGALLVIAQLHRASGGVMSLELDQSFGLSASEIGLVIGAMLLASAVAQLPAGLAFDRFGPRGRSRPWSSWPSSARSCWRSRGASSASPSPAS